MFWTRSGLRLIRRRRDGERARSSCGLIALPLRSIMQLLRHCLSGFLAFFLTPLLVHALWWLSHDDALSWNDADWSSAHLLAPARTVPGAVVLVYAARTGRWKGIFAHHSWVVIKERDAGSYTRFDKVAWGQPVKIDNWAPDARWYGHRPALVGWVGGSAAQELIPKIRAAVATYPFNRRGAYAVWPGPNSNSFVAYVLAAIPEAGIALPPTAIGKDWHAQAFFLGLAPSRTGVAFSLWGALGITVGWVEGIEVNVLGLVTGIDVRRPALKIPGFGRIGVGMIA
jgi:hypothetical protein